ncbi:hypothetical protein CapIbe_019124 [Capra ibex]
MRRGDSVQVGKNERKVLKITSNIGGVTRDHSSPTQNSTFEGANKEYDEAPKGRRKKALSFLLPHLR